MAVWLWSAWDWRQEPPKPTTTAPIAGVCNNRWCPGQPSPFSAHKGDHLSPSEINWDMNVCHWSFFGFGNHYGGVPVGAYGLKEGEPVAQWGY